MHKYACDFLIWARRAHIYECIHVCTCVKSHEISRCRLLFLPLSLARSLSLSLSNPLSLCCLCLLSLTYVCVYIYIYTYVHISVCMYIHTLLAHTPDKYLTQARTHTHTNTQKGASDAPMQIPQFRTDTCYFLPFKPQPSKS